MTRPQFFPQKQQPTPSRGWEASGARDGQHSLRTIPRDGRRLDFRHYLMRSLFGLYSAPVSQEVTRILDVASGTGRWGHEMARCFPHATVVGIDLDLPPQDLKPPENYQFMKANLFHGLPFEDGEFQYVHQRFLGLVTPAAQWPVLLRELVRVTELGGYIELRESGARFHQMGPLSLQMRHWCDEASAREGIDLALMTHLPEMLAHVGLREIKHQAQQVGIGAWAGHRGKMVEADILASLHALKPFICRQANVSPATFDQVVHALPQEWERSHTSYTYALAYGQKEGRSFP